MNKTLSQILEGIRQLSKNTAECIYLGAGKHSVVFKADDATYKLSNEQDYDTVVARADVVNKLAEMGINVPQIYSVRKIDLEQDKPSQMNRLIMGFKAVNFIDMNKINEDQVINDIIDNCLKTEKGGCLDYEENNNDVVFMIQEYLKGKECFSDRFPDSCYCLQEKILRTLAHLKNIKIN